MMNLHGKDLGHLSPEQSRLYDDHFPQGIEAAALDVRHYAILAGEGGMAAAAWAQGDWLLVSVAGAVVTFALGLLSLCAGLVVYLVPGEEEKMVTALVKRPTLTAISWAVSLSWFVGLALSGWGGVLAALVVASGEAAAWAGLVMIRIAVIKGLVGSVEDEPLDEEVMP